MATPSYTDLRPDNLPASLLSLETAPHPRLFATEREFSLLREKAAGDGIHHRMLGRLAFLAAGLLDVPPAERTMTGRRLLGISRLEVYRISTLGLCYRMTGNPAYRDRCIEELRTIARFQDWNPSHFLDVAEMTLAVATGFDWLYDDLSETDRDLIANAIREKGLLSTGPDANWRRSGNNWGQVCHTGMMAGAIAIADRDPALFRRQMAESIRNIAIPMAHYAPGGNYPEGPGYWGYGTGYNVLGLSLLETACGDDFGLSSMPGFAATGHYPDLVYGPSGRPFNYADCGARITVSGTYVSHGVLPPTLRATPLSEGGERREALRATSRSGMGERREALRATFLSEGSKTKEKPPSERGDAPTGQGGVLRAKPQPSSLGIPWWFARHFRDDPYVELRERRIAEEWCADRTPVAPERDNGWFRPYSFFWVDDPRPTSPNLPPLVWNPGGPVPIVVARTSWDDDAVFLGVKAGPPKWSHGHLDGGSFILDAFGERWFEDLGNEEYNRLEQMGVGLWNWKQDSERWRLFRLGSRGHNTLTIDDGLQRVDGCAEVLRVETKEGATTIALDLSSLYSDVCSKVLRTFTFLDSGEVLVEDRLEGLRAGTPVSWRACTARDVASADNDAVVLKTERARLTVRNESGCGRWEVVDVSQPQPEFRGDSPNPGIHQLRLELVASGGGPLDIRVRITPCLP